jgi:SNF2 family DNA or RNA helicase
MLKSNNEAEYFRLVKEQKNERLQSLLHDTDEYMKSLAGKLKHLNQSHDQPESVPTEDSTLIEPEATDEKKIDMDKLLTNRQMYKNIGHERKETISKQPEMMKAAPLRSYQLAGLNWLASLSVSLIFVLFVLVSVCLCSFKKNRYVGIITTSMVFWRMRWGSAKLCKP